MTERTRLLIIERLKILRQLMGEGRTYKVDPHGNKWDRSQIDTWLNYMDNPKEFNNLGGSIVLWMRAAAIWKQT